MSPSPGLGGGVGIGGGGGFGPEEDDLTGDGPILLLEARSDTDGLSGPQPLLKLRRSAADGGYLNEILPIGEIRWENPDDDDSIIKVASIRVVTNVTAEQTFQGKMHLGVHSGLTQAYSELTYITLHPYNLEMVSQVVDIDADDTLNIWCYNGPVTFTSFALGTYRYRCPGTNYYWVINNLPALTATRTVTVPDYNGGIVVNADALDPGADRMLFWDDSAGTVKYLTAGTNLTITGTTIAAAAATIDVQEGDTSVVAAATTLDFDASDFNVTDTGGVEANIALAYGTSAGTPAEGNHTHIGTSLVFIDSDTFSGASSVSFNSVFTSTYRNYLVHINVERSASAELRFRFRAASTDDSNNTYRWVRPGWATGGASGVINGNPETSALLTDNAAVATTVTMTVMNPAETVRTSYAGHAMRMPASATWDMEMPGGGFDNTTAFDGITIFPDSGTITGEIFIYGYKES